QQNKRVLKPKAPQLTQEQQQELKDEASDCPYCSGLIEFPEHGAGEMIDCPHCKRAIVLASC
ncbi:MAG TPA: hypothetical protein VIK28_08510, partial [Sedimentisphaerales bacterium]